MATGDTADFLARIKAVLPARWFPDSTPILDGVLSGPAYAWSYCYGLIRFVRAQARRLTASGVFLDMLAFDFFANFIRRRTSETDANFSIRIGKEMFREKGTRAGLVGALTDLTGRAPVLFEPAYSLDTGGYGYLGMTVGTGLAYGLAGGYGSMLLPFQFFVTAFRPHGMGVASVAGWGSPGGFNGMPGGYGVGAIEWVSPSMFAAPVTDQDILDVINDVKPAATIAWARIKD
jgi:hypothetical protein